MRKKARSRVRRAKNARAAVTRKAPRSSGAQRPAEPPVGIETVELRTEVWSFEIRPSVSPELTSAAIEPTLDFRR